MPNLHLIPGNLPGGVAYCPANYQQFYNDMFSLGVVQSVLAGAGVWVGDTAPTDPISFPVWVRTAGGIPVYPAVWQLYNGVWVAKHSIPANSSFRMIWKGSENDLWSHDGGDGTSGVAPPTTATTGPMWILDHDFDAVFPLGVGTLPSGAAVTQGGTGGEERHSLTADENGPHAHNPPAPNTGFVVTVAGGPGGTGAGAGVAANSFPTAPSGLGTAHNTMPPYRGVYFAKRSSRIFFTQPI